MKAKFKKALVFSAFLSFFSWSTDISRDYLDSIDYVIENRGGDPQALEYLISNVRVQDIDNPLYKDKYIFLKAYFFIYKGDYEKGVKIARDLTESSKDPEIIARANLLLANVLIPTGKWEDGLERLLLARAQLPKVQNRDLIQSIYTVVAISYNKIGEYEKTLRFLENKDKNFFDGKYSCYYSRVTLDAKVSLGLLGLADQEVYDAINSCREDKLVSNIILINLVNAFGSEKPAFFENKIRENIANIRTSDFHYLKSSLTAALISVLYYSKKYQEAIDLGLVFIDEHLDDSTLESKVNVVKFLYQSYYATSQVEQAFKYLSMYVDFLSEYMTEERSKKLALLLSEHLFSEKESEILELNNQNSILHLKSNLIKSQQQNQQMIIVGLLILLIVVVAYGYRTRMIQVRFKRLAERDQLTQIFNRGHFTHLAQSALTFAKESERAVSIILFDLDHFKKINDTYGHAAGDWTLKAVANTCKALGRQNDIFARLGGEEFAVLLSGCDQTTALTLAEKYRKAVAEIDTSDSGFEFAISASFGVTASNLSGYGLDTLLAHADGAMYAAKSAGRNQVVLFEPGNQQMDLSLPRQTVTP